MQQVDISSKSTLLAPRFAMNENVAHTMGGNELLALVNEARKEFGEPVIRANVFADRIKDELEGEHYKSFVVQNSNNTLSTVFELTRDQCMLVSMRESKAVRRKVLDRLNAQPQPVTHLDTARMLVASLEVQAAQAEQLAIAAPKAAFVDQYVEASGSMSFRQVSKLICANERAFRQMLLDKNVMYYLGGVLTPYKPHQDAGRFELKTGTSEHNGHAFSQARFTAKGVQWVAGVWASYLLEVAA